MAATCTTPENVSAYRFFPHVRSDCAGTIAGNRHYSTGTREEAKTVVSAIRLLELLGLPACLPFLRFISLAPVFYPYVPPLRPSFGFGPCLWLSDLGREKTDCIHLGPDELEALAGMSCLERLSLSGLTKLTNKTLKEVSLHFDQV